MDSEIDGRPGVYIRRQVIRHDAERLAAWCNACGVPYVHPAEMHVTLAYSSEPFKPGETESEVIEVPLAGMQVKHLGPKAALVLMFDSPALEARWQAFRDAGASWDYEGYQPHITLSYKASDVDPDALDLEELPRSIRLGPEVVKPIEGFGPDYIEHGGDRAWIAKAEERRTVYGWASVTDEGGEVIFDTQGDSLDEDELVKAVQEFNASDRAGGFMHLKKADGTLQPAGQIVESLVMTKSLQEALGIDLGRSGWLIGYRVDDDDLWAAVKKGEFAAFSIGGSAIRDDVP